MNITNVCKAIYNTSSNVTCVVLSSIVAVIINICERVLFSLPELRLYVCTFYSRYVVPTGVYFSASTSEKNSKYMRIFALRRILNTTPHLHVDGRGWSETLGINVPNKIKLPLLAMGDILVTFKAALEDFLLKDNQMYRSLIQHISQKIPEFVPGQDFIANLDVYFTGEDQEKIDKLALEVDNWSRENYPKEYALSFFVTPFEAYVRNEESFKFCYNVITSTPEYLEVVTSSTYKHSIAAMVSRMCQNQSIDAEGFKGNFNRLFRNSA